MGGFATQLIVGGSKALTVKEAEQIRDGARGARGAVRVALGQLAESAKVRLRVPPEHGEMWAEMVRLVPGLPLRPDVEADPSLKTGEVCLESSLGRVDVGVRTQLEEVERAFFDGPGVRPGANDGVPSPETAGKQE